MTTKKIFIGILSLFILTSLSFYGWKLYQRMSHKIMDPSETIPENAALIWRLNSFSDALNEIKKTESIRVYFSGIFLNDLFKNMDSLNALIAKNEELRPFLIENPCFISAHFSGKDIELLFTFSINPPYDNSEIIENTKSFGRIANVKFKSKNIYRILTEGGAVLFFTFNYGVLSISRSQTLIEKVILRENLAEGNSVANINTKWKRKNENSNFNFHINYKYAYRFLTNIAKNQHIDYFSSLSFFGHTADFELSMDSDNIILNGFSGADSNNSLITVLADQQAHAFHTPEMLPTSTIFYANLTFSDFDNLYQQLIDKNLPFLSSDQSTVFFQKYGKNIKDYFTSWMKSELTLAITTDVYEQMPERCYVIFDTKDIAETTDELNKLRRLFAVSDNNIPDSMNYSGFTIHFLANENLLSVFLGQSFGINTNTYFTFVGKTVVFGNSIEALKYFIDQTLFRNTLEFNRNYSDFEKNISPESNVTLYATKDFGMKIMPDFIHSNFAEYFSENNQILQQFDESGIQLISNGKGCFTNLILHKNNFKYDRTDYKWQLALDDSIVDNQIYSFINPMDKSVIYYALDIKNILYKIDDSGCIQWKIPLIEKPNGKIQTYFSTERNEPIFVYNSKSKIYAINGSGNKVDGFPIKLPSKASEGVSVAEYEKGKYCLLVPTDDSGVLYYYANGKENKNWKRPKISANTNHTIQMFTRNGFNCINISDDNGKVNFYDKNGNSIYNSFSRNFICNYSKVYESLVKKPNYLFFADKNGHVNFIDKSGKIIQKEYTRFDTECSFQYIESNISENGYFVFYSNDKVVIYDQNINRISEFNPENHLNIKSVKLLIDAKDSLWIVFNNLTDNCISIYNINGILEKRPDFTKIENFLLPKATLSNEMYLISVYGRIINCFLF